jgi:hypothetical protein
MERVEGKRNASRNLVGKFEGRRSFGRLKRRWWDNIKINLNGIGWEGEDWIYMAQGRSRRWAVLTVKNLRVP